MNNNLEAGEFNIELKEEEPVWMDKKRYTIFALPISFHHLLFDSDKDSHRIRIIYYKRR